VGYQAHGSDWTLSVSDNGVGMPTGEQTAKPGLGTSIVDSLAKHLGARVQLADKAPGTKVSIVHTQAAAAKGDRAPEVPEVEAV
jgi:two-component sensor histidine kinase